MCVPNCRQKDIELKYYGNNICRRDWELHTDGKINLKQIFKINDEPIKPQLVVVGRKGQTKLNF